VPFRSDDVALTIQSQIHAPPPTLAAIASELGYLTRTDQVVQRLLAKKPEDRPAAARSAAELLRDAIRGDLGDETATRLVKATMAIGSGGIAATVGGEHHGETVWPDPPSAWDPGGQEGRAPPMPADAGPVPGAASLDDRTNPRRHPPVPLIMVGTALLAAAITVGTYGLLDGFAGLTAAAEPPVTDTITIPAARVPPPVDADAIEQAPVAADPEPDEPVARGGQEGEGVAVENAAGAAPASQPVPPDAGDDLDATTRDAADVDPPAKSKPRKTKSSAEASSASRAPKASADERAGGPPTSPPPTSQKSSESKQGTPKKGKSPGDLKDPFGRN
jgi:hypothetical protein